MEKKSLGKNTIYSALKSISTVVFPLITFPYISRVLQPQNVGKFNFSNSVISYFTLIAALGVHTYAIRECSKYRDDKYKLGKIASEIISINIISSLISYLMLFACLLFIPKLKDYSGLILILSTPIVFTTLGADWLNTVMEDFRYITVRTFFFQLLSLLLLLLFVHNEGDYYRYAMIVAFSSSGANITNILYRKRYCKVEFILGFDLTRHLKPIFLLFSMIVAQQIFTVADTTMIGFYLGDVEVGLYSTANKIYAVINQIIGSVVWVVMPQLSKAFIEKDKEVGARVLKYSLQFLVSLGIPLSVGLFILSEEAVLIVGGSSYLDATGTLRVLAITLAVTVFACYALNINILASGQDTIALVACIVPAVFNFVTNYIFIPIFGIEAAAWTTVFSQLLIVFICLPFIPKGYGNRKLLLNTWKPLLATFFMALVCAFVKIKIGTLLLRVFLCVLMSAVVYVTILIFLKYDFIDEILKRVIRKKRKA